MQGVVNSYTYVLLVSLKRPEMQHANEKYLYSTLDVLDGDGQDSFL